MKVTLKENEILAFKLAELVLEEFVEAYKPGGILVHEGIDIEPARGNPRHYSVSGLTAIDGLEVVRFSFPFVEVGRAANDFRGVIPSLWLEGAQIWIPGGMVNIRFDTISFQPQGGRWKLLQMAPNAKEISDLALKLKTRNYQRLRAV